MIHRLLLQEPLWREAAEGLERPRCGATLVMSSVYALVASAAVALSMVTDCDCCFSLFWH